MVGGGEGAEHKVKTGKHNVDYNTINQLWSSIITHFKRLNLSLELSQVATISQFFFYAQSESSVYFLNSFIKFKPIIQNSLVDFGRNMLINLNYYR